MKSNTAATATTSKQQLPSTTRNGTNNQAEGGGPSLLPGLDTSTTKDLTRRSSSV